jgi:hypothetical protein
VTSSEPRKSTRTSSPSVRCFYIGDFLDQQLSTLHLHWFVPTDLLYSLVPKYLLLYIQRDVFAQFSLGKMLVASSMSFQQPHGLFSAQVVGSLSCLVLSCLVLSCLVLSCRVLSCPALSCHVLSRPVLPCLVLSCLCLVLSSLVLSCLVLSCRVWSCLV